MFTQVPFKALFGFAGFAITASPSNKFLLSVGFLDFRGTARPVQ